ncbi:MAG: glycosyltransferase family 9 protein [Ignavibacteria bacterium]|nr:glycosyltransferase family 9 protein [Ignavibacteria bacterium]
MTRGHARILITRMRFIGDVVLTTPAIRSVRTTFPDAFIAYLGDRSAVSLLEGNPCLNEIIPFDYSRPSVFEQTRISLVLRRRRFDLAIDLFGNPRSALLTWLSGARVRVGPERRGRGRFYTVQVADDGRPKTPIQFHDQYLRAAGVTPSSDQTELFLTEDERRDARIYLQWLDHETSPLDMKKPIIGLHPGGTWPAKQWLPGRFAELAELIRAKMGAQVVLTIGPNDEEAARSVLVATAADVKLLRGLPLRQLAAVVSHFRAFVTNDCGPMHIAAALGVPTIGLFGPGEENIWFPYPEEKGHHALRIDVPCHPCHLDICNLGGDEYMQCMKLLTVGEVFSTLRKSTGL